MHTFLKKKSILEKPHRILFLEAAIFSWGIEEIFLLSMKDSLEIHLDCCQKNKCINECGNQTIIMCLSVLFITRIKWQPILSLPYFLTFVRDPQYNNVCVCVCVCIYICICLHICIHIYLYTCKYTSVYIYIYKYLYIYIYSHPQTDCFVLSELFSVARHAGRSKPGSKPVQLYVRLCFRPLVHQADHVG